MSNESDQVAFQQLDCHLHLAKVYGFVWILAEPRIYIVLCRFFKIK